MKRAITLYECPEPTCRRYADAAVVQDNGCYLAGHGQPVLATAMVCGVCSGRDLGTTDGPRGERMPVVCGACTPDGAGSADRIAALEAAIRETQTRALNMSEMRLSAFQRQTLANVVEPLSCVMVGKPFDGMIDMPEPRL